MVKSCESGSIQSVAALKSLFPLWVSLNPRHQSVCVQGVGEQTPMLSSLTVAFQWQKQTPRLSSTTVAFQWPAG